MNGIIEDSHNGWTRKWGAAQIARCVSIMVFYHNEHKASKATERIIAEVQLGAGWVRELALSPGGADWLILRPVENELYARFGHEVAPRLYAEFIDAFASLNIPLQDSMRGDTIKG